MSEEPRRVPAAARAAALLRHLARTGRPLAAAALARDLGLPRTSVVGICDALADERMLARMDDGRFWLGSHVLELAAASSATLERELAVGLLIVSGANPFYAAAIAAAEAELTTGGRLLVRDAREDADLQREQWHELIDEGADVLIVDAVDAATHEHELGLAREAGVPVIAIGSRLDGVDASVTSDNTQAGLLAGRRLAAQLGGRGRIAVLDGLEKNANIDRVAGLREAIRDDPALTIVAHEQEGHDTTEAGTRMMRRLLEREEGIDAVFTVCDPIAIGAVAALEEAGASVPIVSVDGRGDAIDAILAGGPIVASVAQEPAKILTTAIATARDLARGRRTAQGAHLIPVRLIDEHRARGYERWG